MLGSMSHIELTRKYDGLTLAKRRAVILALRKMRTKAGAARHLRVPESTLYRNIHKLEILNSEWMQKALRRHRVGVRSMSVRSIG